MSGAGFGSYLRELRKWELKGSWLSGNIMMVEDGLCD